MTAERSESGTFVER